MTNDGRKTASHSVAAPILWALVWSVAVVTPASAKDRTEAPKLVSSASDTAMPERVEDARRPAKRPAVTTTSVPLELSALPPSAFEDWDLSLHQ